MTNTTSNFSTVEIIFIIHPEYDFCCGDYGEIDQNTFKLNTFYCKNHYYILLGFQNELKLFLCRLKSFLNVLSFGLWGRFATVHSIGLHCKHCKQTNIVTYPSAVHCRLQNCGTE